MSLDPIQVQCDQCGSSFIAAPHRTFLGFQRLNCQNCQAKIVYPLTAGFRITYWAIAVLMLLFAVNAFKSGGYAYPGGLGIAVLFAIYRDWALQKKTQTTPLQSAPRYSNRITASNSPATSTCASCNYTAPVQVKFCPECGAKIVPEPTLQAHSAAREQTSSLPRDGQNSPLTKTIQPPFQTPVKVKSSVESNDRLLLLCQRLRTGDLALDQYEVLARAVGASIRREGIFGGKYIVTQGYTMVAFNNIPSMKPWFIEHVLPAIESKA